MQVPKLLVFTQLNAKLIQFGPVTQASTPFANVIDATVVCTLYTNRITGKSAGTPVAEVSNVALAYVGNGVYQATIGDANFNPPVGSNYVTVFDLTSPTVGAQHWEIPSSVQVRIS